jgi:maltokinase
MEPTPALTALVEAWLPQQRWFGGKGRDIEHVTVRSLGTVGVAQLLLADVRYADGGIEHYQVPIVLHDHPSETLDHVLLGTVGEGDGVRWVFDALHDKEITGAWLTGIRDELHDGAVHFRRTAEPEAIPVDEPSLVLSGEQSNTSLIYRDIAILKVFRRLQPGINPDVEVQEQLTRLGAVHVPRLLGHVSAELDGEATSLAMCQEFMTTASDGWELAKTSVRDLMAEGDLHADEAGGDFAAEAERLGVAVAEVHRDLRQAFGVSRLSPDDWRKRVDVMHAKLAETLASVPELNDIAGLETGLRTVYDRAAEAVPAEGLEVQRIHGDLHLGQALRTVRRWVLIDFEGEPLADMHSRREHDSALRDVAGMLRSFDYAGHHRVIETAGPIPQLTYRAEEWSQRNRDAFCTGYAESAGTDPREQAAVLKAFEVEKAVYEAVYEARNRPSWLPIPLASLRTLVEGA